MAKQGQHHDDDHDQAKSKGPNNPRKSVTITTGSYKKKETYEQQARAHEDPYKPAQAAGNEWNEDTHKYPGGHGTSWHRLGMRGRTGSDSNASRRTRGH
jgi:hypothetical protein